jgi:hypothetical protein
MTNSRDAQQQSPLACDMSAIEAGRTEQHIITGKVVFQAVTEIQRLCKSACHLCLIQASSL